MRVQHTSPTPATRRQVLALAGVGTAAAALAACGAPAATTVGTKAVTDAPVTIGFFKRWRTPTWR